MVAGLTTKPLGLADLLTAGKKTTILAGAGCVGAHDQLIALAERLKAPIVHALRGKDAVEYDNPYDVGMTGLVGFASGYRALKTCDVLLMLGTDFPYADWYPEGKTIIQLDIRPERLGRRSALDLGLNGDVKETLTALLPHLDEKLDSAHLESALEHYHKARARLDRHVKGVEGKRPIHPEYLTAVASEVAAEDAIFTADVGMSTVWAARYLRMTQGRRLLGSFTHGSMANALPQAIGAQVRYPDRQIIALSGDGGFAMLMGDFLTLTQLALPVKVIIYNNGSLGMVKLEQNVAGLRDYGTELDNPNFARVADAMGATGIRVEDPSEVRSFIALSGDGGFAMLMGDFLTLTQLALPVKVIIYNNGSLGMVKLEQNVAGLRDYGTELDNPNFARVADAMGATGIRVEDPSEVRSALERALRTDGPVLVDVLTNPSELSLPPKVSPEHARGYSLYLLKEVLGGGARSILEELESNLR